MRYIYVFNTFKKEQGTLGKDLSIDQIRQDGKDQTSIDDKPLINKNLRVL